MAIETKPWDSAEMLTTEEDVAGYLKVAIEDEELPEIFGNAVDVAARARGGYQQLSRETGIPETELTNAVALLDSRALPTVKKIYEAYLSRSSSRLVA